MYIFFLTFYYWFFKQITILNLSTNTKINGFYIVSFYMIFIYVPIAWAYYYNYNLWKFFFIKNKKVKINYFNILINIFCKNFLKFITGLPFIILSGSAFIVTITKSLLKYKRENFQALFYNLVLNLSTRFTNTIIIRIIDLNLIFNYGVIIFNPFDFNENDIDDLFIFSSSEEFKNWLIDLNSLYNFLRIDNSILNLKYSSINNANYHYTAHHELNNEDLLFGCVITFSDFTKITNSEEKILNDFEEKPNLLGKNEINKITPPQLWNESEMILKKKEELNLTRQDFFRQQTHLFNVHKSIIKNIYEQCLIRKSYGVEKNNQNLLNINVIEKNLDTIVNDKIKIKFENILNFSYKNINYFKKNSLNNKLFINFLKSIKF